MKIPFHEQLQIWLSQKRWSQKDLADATNRSESSISFLTSGKREPTMDVLREIARALDKSEAEVFAAAGKLSLEGSGIDVEKESLMYMFDQFTKEEKRMIVEIVEVMLDRKRRKELVDDDDPLNAGNKDGRTPAKVREGA